MSSLEKEKVTFPFAANMQINCKLNGVRHELTLDQLSTFLMTVCFMKEKKNPGKFEDRSDNLAFDGFRLN